jgi:hypothetical protein
MLRYDDRLNWSVKAPVQFILPLLGKTAGINDVTAQKIATGDQAWF